MAVVRKEERSAASTVTEAAFASFLIILTSMPPSGGRRSSTSSMKLRMRKMPRPLDFSMFSGRQRVGHFFRLEAFALVADADRQAAGVGIGRRRELDVDHLREVAAVAVLDGVDHRLANGDADPVHRVFVEPDAATQMVADQLDEIEHVERAAEFQANDFTERTRHAGGTGRGDTARGKWITQRNWPVKPRNPAAAPAGAARADVARCACYSGRMPSALEARIAPARRVTGRMRVPGDKSISHRYALLGALAQRHHRRSPTTPPAPTASPRWPASHAGRGDHHRPRSRQRHAMRAPVTIVGRGLRGLQAPRGPLDAGNSGTTTRLLSGILAAHHFASHHHRRRVAQPPSDAAHHCAADADGRAVRGRGRLPADDDHGGPLTPIDFAARCPARRSRAPCCWRAFRPRA